MGCRLLCSAGLSTGWSLRSPCWRVKIIAWLVFIHAVTLRPCTWHVSIVASQGAPLWAVLYKTKCNYIRKLRHSNRTVALMVQYSSQVTLPAGTCEYRNGAPRDAPMLTCIAQDLRVTAWITTSTQVFLRISKDLARINLHPGLLRTAACTPL